MSIHQQGRGLAVYEVGDSLLEAIGQFPVEFVDQVAVVAADVHDVIWSQEFFVDDNLWLFYAHGADYGVEYLMAAVTDTGADIVYGVVKRTFFGSDKAIGLYDVADVGVIALRVEIANFYGVGCCGAGADFFCKIWHKEARKLAWANMVERAHDNTFYAAARVVSCLVFKQYFADSIR